MQQALILAFDKSDFSDFENCIRAGTNVDELLEDGKTALHQSIECGNYDMVQFLIQNGANPNLMNHYSPLWIAASYGEKEIYDFLFPLTDLELSDEAEKMMSYTLEQNQARENIDPLINKLSDAVTESDHKKIMEIINLGVDINSIDSFENTALLISVSLGKPEILKLLLEFGADPNKREGSYSIGTTPLLKAIRSIYNREEKISCRESYFKDKKANPERIKIIELLLQAGADSNLVEDEFSPLRVAIESNDIQVFRMILKVSSDVIIQNTLQQIIEGKIGLSINSDIEKILRNLIQIYQATLL